MLSTYCNWKVNDSTLLILEFNHSDLIIILIANKYP